MAAVGKHPVSHHRNSVTQLEFHQAMQDFKTMFPDLDIDVIECVLRSNNGAVDSTIDQLLAMTTDNENEKLRTELDVVDNAEIPPRYSPATPPPSYNQAFSSPSSTAKSSLVNVSDSGTISKKDPHRLPLSVPLHETLSRQTASPQFSPVAASTSLSEKSESNIPLRVKRNWHPPILGPLPSTFLRVDGHWRETGTTKRRAERVSLLSSAMLQQRMEENERQRKMGGSDDPELAQCLEDERIAIFLQNEEFMQELRRNKEFMVTLEQDTGSRQRVNNRNFQGDNELSSQDEDEDVPDAMGAYPYTRPAPQTEDPDAAFHEKLKNMGKMSKKKFAQLARIFTRRKRRNFRQFLGEGPNPSRDNLLLHEDEYSELSEDEFENERKKEAWNSHPTSDNEHPNTPERTRREIV